MSSLQKRIKPCFQEGRLVEAVTIAKLGETKASTKRRYIKIPQNSHESTCARVSFFNKVAGPRQVDSDKGVFLWILRNF